MHAHETYSRALRVWYSMRPPLTTCRQPRPSQPRPLPTWRRWTIRRGAQALLRDTSACSRVASACPHEADAHADTRAASVGGAPRWRRPTGPREAMSSQPCEVRSPIMWTAPPTHQLLTLCVPSHWTRTACVSRRPSSLYVLLMLLSAIVLQPGLQAVGLDEVTHRAPLTLWLIPLRIAG